MIRGRPGGAAERAERSKATAEESPHAGPAAAGSALRFPIRHLRGLRVQLLLWTILPLGASR